MERQKSFQLRTLSLVGAGLIALVAIVVAAFVLAGRTAELNAALVQARSARLVISEVQISIIDMETGQRGYLLTQDDTYLVPYEAARQRLARDMPLLRLLFKNDRASTSDVEELSPVVRAKLDELARTIALVKSSQLPAALALVRTDLGQSLMQEARDVIARMLKRSEGRVQNYSERLGGITRLLQWVTVIAGSLILLFGGAATWLIVQNLRETIRARRSVEALNVTLESRVAERTSALTRANEEIQRFAYIVSHDLRAPLVNIMGFTSELELGIGTLQRFIEKPGDAMLAEQANAAVQEEMPESLRFIRTSTGKMDGLINAILKLSREGRRELHPEQVSLADVISAAMANVQHRVEEKNVKLETNGQFPTVVSDRLALEQIFGNILDNALKYLAKDRQGHIVIEGGRRGRMVTVDIRDNGRGIADQDRERIFELFRRAGAQDQPGEGIGLAHVRALARKLRGDITVTSEFGVGSTFRIELPEDISRFMRQNAV